MVLFKDESSEQVKVYSYCLTVFQASTGLMALIIKVFSLVTVCKIYHLELVTLEEFFCNKFKIHK